MSVQDVQEIPLIVQMKMHVSIIRWHVHRFNVCWDSMQTGNNYSLRKNIKTKTSTSGTMLVGQKTLRAELCGHSKAFQEQKPNTDCKELKRKCHDLGMFVARTPDQLTQKPSLFFAVYWRML